MNDLLAHPGARSPSLPTVARYPVDFSPQTIFYDDARGRNVEKIDLTIDVTAYTRLIPEADCRAAIAEVDGALSPAGRDSGVKLARVLIGSYPAREVTDPEIYVRAIASIFEAAPADIGRAAIDELTRRLRFLPTRADIAEVVDRMVSARRYAKLVAEAHLRERARRTAAREEAAKCEREAAEFRQKHGAAWDAWMKLPILGRPRFKEFRATWTDKPE